MELLFDAAAETAVKNVWEVVRAVSGGSVLQDMGARPHVSLAVYDADADRAALERVVAAFQAPALDFVLASVGAFPGDEGVIFLAPVVAPGLLDLHRRWHEAAPGADAYYRPGEWAPHATVGIFLPETALKDAFAVARPALPIRGRYESLTLIEFEGALADAARNRPKIEYLVEQALGA